MGRKRVIDQDRILDAAERVVARDGAVRLTLDAVALEAGVSKASVLYDYKSKQAMVEAVVERAFRADNAFHHAVTQGLGPVDSPTIRGRIAAAAVPPTDSINAVALNLTAALALDQGLRTRMQANQQTVLAAIADTSASPRGARLAYLALEGLKLLEHLDFHRFDPAERQTILREIEWLVECQPQPKAENLAD